MLDDQLTADPLGLVARTTSGGSSVATSAAASANASGLEGEAIATTPEGLLPTAAAHHITQRRRQPRQLFSTPGATTAASAGGPWGSRGPPAYR